MIKVVRWPSGYPSGFDPRWYGLRKNNHFHIIMERDSEGYYVGSVPALPGCHTQARSLDELSERIKEAIALYLEVAALL
jgi:predicted RNase H-like HicB family nuclease